MALNESIQLEREIEKASTSSKTHYGQLTTHPKDVRKYESSHGSDTRNYGEYRSKRYNDPYTYNQGYQQDHSRPANRFQRHESRGPSRFGNNWHNRFDRSRSPRRFHFRDRRPCWSNEYPRTKLSLRNMSCIDVAVHGIHLQTANVLHHWNKSWWN